jgi:hypothetical protein
MTSLNVEKIPQKLLKVKSDGLSFPRIPCSFEHVAFVNRTGKTLFTPNEQNSAAISFNDPP